MNKCTNLGSDIAADQPFPHPLGIGHPAKFCAFRPHKDRTCVNFWGHFRPHKDRTSLSIKQGPVLHEGIYILLVLSTCSKVFNEECLAASSMVENFMRGYNHNSIEA